MGVGMSGRGICALGAAVVTVVVSTVCSSAFAARPATTLTEATCTVDGTVGALYGSFSWDGPDPAAWQLNGTRLDVTKDERKANRVFWGATGGSSDVSLVLEDRRGTVVAAKAVACTVVPPS